MTTFLDAIGPAVWRASWQAAALAVVIAVLLRCFGDRVAPRWRYLLWGLVIARLLVVTTPSSPWSAFNLIGGNPQQDSRQAVALEIAPQDLPNSQPIVATRHETSGPRETVEEPALVMPSKSETAAQPSAATAPSPPTVPAAVAAGPTAGRGAPFVASVVRSLPYVWLAGCLLFAAKLAAAAFMLRRRLAACRPVTDPAVLKLLEDARRQIGLKRAPALLVTPEAVSPCLVGTWNPRVVVPEALMTGSAARMVSHTLSHVLTHELAHLARGDLWTNWLLLAARVLHWFNPIAWLTIRQMQSEREAACDELALTVLGQRDRKAYAATIVDLASSLLPSGIAPGMIGLFASPPQLHSRVDRLLRSPSVAAWRSPLAATLLLVVAAAGLTDAMPAATAEPPAAKSAAGPAASKTATGAAQAKFPGATPRPNAAPSPVKRDEPPAANGPRAQAPTRTLRGQCIDHANRSALAGVLVRIFKAQGRTSPIVEQAQTVTDREGRFEFPDLVPPRPDDPVDRLIYLVFAEMKDRPIGFGGTWTLQERDPDHMLIHILRDQTTLKGTVHNALGQPVQGATVAQWDIDGRSVPGIVSAKTDAEGRFQIDRIPDFKQAFGRRMEASFMVSHADYPQTPLRVADLPGNVKVSLPDGCRVTGTVIDSVTGQPAAGAALLAQNTEVHSETPAMSDAAGRFQMVLAEGTYTFLANAPDRVCVALTDRECLAGETVELPPFKLIAGGLISGRVLISATDEALTVSESGQPIDIGLYGPSHPQGKVISPLRLAKVDETGRFTLRAAPGENFPYFVNIHGDRMAWDTTKQPPVIVKDGETTTYNMLVTPKIPPAEKLKAARLIVESLPKPPQERTAQIILEFRKLEHTVDETELWCTLMQALVGVGPAAVPQLCAELDATTENRTLRRLAFALRAIGDPRAVPALIRAIPRTLLPSSSDYGLLVEDRDLTAFMQKHDLAPGEGNAYFDLGRPEREVYGALLKLTGRAASDVEPWGFSRSEDPRRVVLQRRIVQRKAQEWQAWWEANCRKFTSDAAYQKVNLEIIDEALPPATQTLGPQARFSNNEGWIGAVLSPAVEKNEYAWHFLDLDSGYQPRWPAHIPRDEGKIHQQKLAKWAAETGVDLMCITHRAPDGKETYVLKSFGLKAWEIGPRELRNIDKLVAAGKLPEGRDVGELLMHYDAESERLVPDANGAFLFTTRDGSMGLIEITDHVVRTQNLAGAAGAPPGGVGFHLGVRFNLRMIVP